MNRRNCLIGLMGLGLSFPAIRQGPRAAEERSFLLGTTTTIEGTGLMRHLKERFTAQTGIGVRSVVQGTGQILDIARRGDVDAVLTHDPQAEKAFVGSGFGVERRVVFWNGFVLVGPKSDPAGIRGLRDPAAALRRIAGGDHAFVSRADGSGTHMAEMRLWAMAGIDPAAARETKA
jgi:tungstate transport system substrate-binding protein